MWRITALTVLLISMVLSVWLSLWIGTRMAPYNLPLEPLQWRHMGVKASQINWSLFRRAANKKHQSSTLQPFWDGNPQLTSGIPLQRQVLRISMCLRHHIPGALVHEANHNQNHDDDNTFSSMMLMSWHTHLFRITNPLSGKSAPGLPFKGSILLSINVFVLLAWSSSWQMRCRWFDTPWCSCDVTIMIKASSILMC